MSTTLVGGHLVTVQARNAHAWRAQQHGDAIHSEAHSLFPHHENHPARFGWGARVELIEAAVDVVDVQ
jgi:hypothetical protein